MGVRVKSGRFKKLAGQAGELLLQVCVRIVQSSDLEPSSEHQI